MKRRGLWLAMALAMGGCAKDAKETPAPAQGTPPAQGAPQAQGTPPAATPPTQYDRTPCPACDPVACPECEPPPEATAEQKAAVDTFLAAWVKTQTDGDFAAYSALYADRFRGIRRSGPRTVKLDRAGWMKDRERMFKKKMLVKA